jgi:hypothetical protein
MYYTSGCRGCRRGTADGSSCAGADSNIRPSSAMTSRLFRLSAECLRGRVWWAWVRLLLSVEVKVGANESMLSADIGQ